MALEASRTLGIRQGEPNICMAVRPSETIGWYMLYNVHTGMYVHGRYNPHRSGHL